MSLLDLTASQLEQAAQMLCEVKGQQPYTQLPGTPIMYVDLAKEEITAYIAIVTVLERVR